MNEWVSETLIHLKPSVAVVNAITNNSSSIFVAIVK